MKLAMRAKAFSKKVTLFSTAFILAVSSLTAVVPFVLSRDAAAINPNCEVEFSATSQKCVRTLAELNAAINDVTISQIILDDTIETTVPILITRPLLLNGHDEKIKFVGDTDGWQGNYVVKVFNATNVRINSLQLEGGDAGLQVNVSEVNLAGNMRFINHEYGNIELTKSSDTSLTRAPKLSVASRAVLAGDNNTTPQKPYVWVATNAVSDASVSEFFYRGINRTPFYPQNAGQHWYFANPNITGVVATVVETGDVFETPQAAVDAATTGQTVLLNRDVNLDKALVINKAITLNGDGKALTAAYSHTGIADDNGKFNTVIVVASNDVTIKNVITDNIASGQKPHGIVVDYKTGVKLENVTLQNGRAGMIVNGSEVTATNLTTYNNSWYGVNVDKPGAELTVEGVSGHESNVFAIYAENAAQVTVDDVAHQYARIGNPVDSKNLATDVAYVLKSAVPVADVKVNGKDANVLASDKDNSSPVEVQGVVTGPNAPKYHYFKITGTGIPSELTHIITSTNRNVAFNLRDVPGVPLDSKSRVKEGTYNIRYVVFDALSIRNDAVASETVTVTVDNTAPLTGAILSNGAIVSNNALPTLTVNATDANGIDYTQYRVQNIDGSSIAGYGWVPIPDSGTVELPELANLVDGTYRVNVRTFDNAGNKTNTLIEFTIDRSITSSVAVSSLTSLTPELSGVAQHSDGSLAANVDLVITVDGIDEYEVTTDAFGVWSVDVVVTGSEAGVSHTVAVALKGSDPAATPAGTRTFVTTLQSQTQSKSENSQGDATTTQGAAARGATQPQLPSVTGPAGQPGAAALGAGDEAGKESALGASTEKTLADAVDANNTDGKALGLAWYWWILIVAALATIVWWIVAAVRKRNAES